MLAVEVVNELSARSNHKVAALYSQRREVRRTAWDGRRLRGLELADTHTHTTHCRCNTAADAAALCFTLLAPMLSAITFCVSFIALSFSAPSLAIPLASP